MKTQTAKNRILLFIGVILVVASLACMATVPEEQPTAPQLVTETVQETQPPQVEYVSPLPEGLVDEQQVLATLYDRISPAVVNITIFVRQNDVVIASGQGSGFVYDREGHIVTNAHVVQDAAELDVTFSTGIVRSGEVVGMDLNSDLAVVKISDLPQDISPIPLGNIEDVVVGQTVLAIGNPFGLDGTMTRGIVSALGRTIPALNTFSIPQAIQTDAPINPGNSGGPLLNLDGQVIGVNAQIETSGQVLANSGVGFAIPVSIISRVVPDLISQGHYDWAWLGVRGGSLTPAMVAANDLEVEQGAYLSVIIDGGPASKVGLRGSTSESTFNDRPVELGGDVIVAIDGQPVRSFDDLLIYIALNAGPETTVTLTVVRDGKELSIPVTLEARPETVAP